MFNHITIGSGDLTKSARFYDATLSPLGLQRRPGSQEESRYFHCWVEDGQNTPRFYVVIPFNDEPATYGNGTMISFVAASNEIVDQAYQAAISNGGTCDGPAGYRPQFGDDYYGCYVRDPDNNKIHIVREGSMASAPSINAGN